MYFWLKMKQGFFDRRDIKILEKETNGKEYVLFYIKLLLESIDQCGKLRLNDSTPLSVQDLSAITNTNIEITEKALEILLNRKMVEMLEDGTLLMKEVERNIGSETAGAARMRKMRENASPSLCDGDVTNCDADVQKSDTDIELHKEKEKRDIVTATSTPLPDDPAPKTEQAAGCPYEKIKDLYNSICGSFAKIRSIDGTRKTAVSARWKACPQLSTFEELFKTAEASDFLKGGGEKKWRADFDWMMKATNFSKVLEHRYDNRPKDSRSSFDVNDLEKATLAKYRQLYGGKTQ